MVSLCWELRQAHNEQITIGDIYAHHMVDFSVFLSSRNVAGWSKTISAHHCRWFTKWQFVLFLHSFHILIQRGSDYAFQLENSPACFHAIESKWMRERANWSAVCVIERVCNLMRVIILVCIEINYCLHAIDGEMVIYERIRYQNTVAYSHPVNYRVAWL